MKITFVVIFLLIASSAHATAAQSLFKPTAQVIHRGKIRSFFLKTTDRVVTEQEKKLGFVPTSGFSVGPFSCDASVEDSESKVSQSFFVTVTCADPKFNLWKVTRLCVDERSDRAYITNTAPSILSLISGRDKANEAVISVWCYADEK